MLRPPEDAILDFDRAIASFSHAPRTRLDGLGFRLIVEGVEVPWAFMATTQGQTERRRPLRPAPPLPLGAGAVLYSIPVAHNRQSPPERSRRASSRARNPRSREFQRLPPHETVRRMRRARSPGRIVLRGTSPSWNITRERDWGMGASLPPVTITSASPRWMTGRRPRPLRARGEAGPFRIGPLADWTHLHEPCPRSHGNEERLTREGPFSMGPAGPRRCRPPIPGRCTRRRGWATLPFAIFAWATALLAAAMAY